MGFGNANVPGPVATTVRNGTMSASDKLALEALKSLIPFTLMERTASGNPATFVDGVAGDVKNLSVTMTPTQSGSGDPSPTNVRPISGVTSVRITRHNAPSCALTITPTQSGSGDPSPANVRPIAPGVSFTMDDNSTLTVYGGTLDVATGTLSVTYRKLTLTSAMISSAAPYKAGFPGVWLNGYANQMAQYPAYNPDNLEWNTAYSLCNAVPVAANPYSFAIRGICLRYTGGLCLRLAASDIPGFEDTDDEEAIISAVGQFLDNNAIELVYRLATPITYMLTLTETERALAALAGYNSVSADAGSASVTYRANPTLAYEELMNAILSAGAGI